MTHSLSLPFEGCVFLGASLLAVAVNATEVKVFSSPAASGALTEVVPQFERATGHKVLLDFANIAATRKRIAAGETFDIAIVSPKAIEELLQQGTIAAGTQYNIGRTGLGAWSRARALPSPTSARSMRSSARCSAPSPSATPPRARAGSDSCPCSTVLASQVK